MIGLREWFALWLLLTLASLGLVPLFDLDEAIYAQTAWEMLQSGDWIVPQANGIHFFEKPPLLYYVMDGAFTLFGHNSFAARLPSLLFSLATVWLLIYAGRRLVSQQVGWLAALLFVSMLEVGLLAHAAILDAALNFFVAATLLWWWLWLTEGNKRDLLLAALMMGLAVSVKGPVGVVVPLAIIGVERLLTGQLIAALRTTPWQPVIAIFLLAATPWYAMILWQNGPAFLWEFIMVHNIGRALHPMQGHGGHWHYYLVVLAVSVLPWLMLLPRLGKGLMQGEQQSLSRFLLIGVVLTVLIFSLAQTKLPHYISSIYPLLALMMAIAIGKKSALARWEAWATVALLLPVALLVALLPWVWSWLTPLAHHPRAVAVLAQGISPGWHNTLAALPLLVLLGWLLRARAVSMLVGVGVALQAALFLGVVPLASALMQGPKLAIADAIRQLPATTPILSYNLNAPSISFAAQRNYAITLDQAGREQIANQTPPYALIMRSESRAQFPLLQQRAAVVDRGGFLLFIVR
ncbi:MAG: glycosyltransferase family 39 protein [Mariprofundales bacterium]